MNILIVTATYHPRLNGVAVSTYRMVNSLRKLGHRVYLVVPELLGDNGFLDKKLASIKSMSRNSDVGVGDSFYLPTFPSPVNKDYPFVVARMSGNLKKWLEDKEIDVVHTQHPSVIGTLAQKIAVKKDAPLFFTYHTKYGDYAHYFPFLPKKMSKKVVKKSVNNFCSKCDGVITPTKFMKDYLENDFLENNIDVPVYYNSTAGLKSIVGLEYIISNGKNLVKKLDKNKFNLISIARHAQEKNLEVLIDIMKYLPAKYHLTMVGDGPHHDSLKDYAQDVFGSDMKDKITFTGAVAQDEISDYLAVADVFVYSTLTDTLGISILESMAVGLPVVAVSKENTRELIVDGKTGVLVKEDTVDNKNDVEEKDPAEQTHLAENMAGAIEDLASNEGRYLKMREESLKESKKFYIDSLAESLVEIYSLHLHSK